MHRNHIAVDRSFRGVAGKFAACGWAVVQLDRDVEDEPWCAMHSTMPLKLNVQRTIKRTEMWVLYVALMQAKRSCYHFYRQSGRGEL